MGLALLLAISYSVVPVLLTALPTRPTGRRPKAVSTFAMVYFLVLCGPNSWDRQKLHDFDVRVFRSPLLDERFLATCPAQLLRFDPRFVVQNSQRVLPQFQEECERVSVHLLQTHLRISLSQLPELQNRGIHLAVQAHSLPATLQKYFCGRQNHVLLHESTDVYSPLVQGVRPAWTEEPKAYAYLVSPETLLHVRSV